MMCNFAFWSFYAKCIRGLDKINLIWWIDFKLQRNFSTTPAASKNITCFKKGQKRPDNNNLNSLTKVKSKSMMMKIGTVMDVTLRVGLWRHKYDCDVMSGLSRIRKIRQSKLTRGSSPVCRPWWNPRHIRNPNFLSYLWCQWPRRDGGWRPQEPQRGCIAKTSGGS